MYLVWGVYLVPGVYLVQGGVPGLEGVYLVPGGYLVWGVYLVLGGTWSRRRGCTWSQGGVPGLGVYLVRYSPREQNHTHL